MFQLDESLKVENDQGVTATVNTTQLFYPPGVNKEHDGQEGILVKETLLLQKGDASKAVSSSGEEEGGWACVCGGREEIPLPVLDAYVGKGCRWRMDMELIVSCLRLLWSCAGWYYTGGSGGGDRGDGNKDLALHETLDVGGQQIDAAVASSGDFVVHGLFLR
jgi:hypothetical protein